MTPTLPSKTPYEIVPVTFDFSNRVAGISAATWEVSLVSGVDNNPSIMLSGVPSNSNGKTRQYIGGGVDGNTYLLRAFVTDANTSARYEYAAYLPVAEIN